MIHLEAVDTSAPGHLNKEEIISQTNTIASEIGDLQHILYAQRKYAMLVVLQGMDGSGKDGTTSAVFSQCTPGAIHVKSFKKPSAEELAHDFLWRVHQHAPERGYIQVFNRSHYEDILIQYVHGWIDDAKRAMRMKAINAFENVVQEDNNTVLLKFYLHISEKRQKSKLLERISDPKKQWKHADGDWEERKHWKAYMQAYSYALQESETPWTIVPADQSWYRNYVVATRVRDALRALELKLPGIDSEKFK